MRLAWSGGVLPRATATLATLVALGFAPSSVPGCARAPATPATSVDDAYPRRAVRLIVPFPAGGGADFWGRLLASTMTETLRQPVVVENVPGTGGNVGTAAAARAPADGYTILLGSTGPLAVHPFTYEALPFDAGHDFVPVAMLESSPIVLVVHPSVPATSLSDLIALARAKPSAFTFATNGNGSPEQIAAVLFDEKAGVEIRDVPFDGAGRARRELASGGVTMMFDPCKAALPAIEQGKERALAVADEARSRALPDVPTFDEVGIHDLELRIWTGVLAPRGTPAAVVSILHDAIQQALDTPVVRKAIADQGSDAARMSPAQFSEFIQSERSRWKRLVAETGLPSVSGPL